MNRFALEFQNRYLEKQYQKRVSDQSSRLMRRILVGYFVFYVIPEIAESSIGQDYNNIDSNEVLSIIGYLLLSVCYIGLTKKKELYNYICLVAHIAILLTGMLGMIKHTKQNNHHMSDLDSDQKSSWQMQNIFQYSAIQVGFHFIISLISSSIKVTLAAVTVVYATFTLYIVILVGEGSGTSKFSVVMIIFFAFIACQMYFIHYNHKIKRQNFLHQFNDKQFTNILKNGLNQNIFFVSYNQTLNNIDIWFSNKSCEKYFSSQNKGEFKKFTRSVYLQEQVSSQSEEFYPDGNGILGGKSKKGDNNNNNYGNITDELSLEQKKKSLQASSKDKNAKLENVIIELIKAQIKKQKHKNYYDFSQFKKYLAIQKEDVASTQGKNGNTQNGQVKQGPVKEKLFQFKINTFIRNSCFNSCIIFNEEEWDKYNGLYKDKCSLQMQKQQDFIQMLQPVIQKMEPYAYLHETLVACVNQSATLLNNMLLYNFIVQNKYDNKQITLPDYLGDFSLTNLLEYIRISNSIFFPIKYDVINGSTSIENIIIHSNQKRVAQILQNFILEIGRFVGSHRKNNIIDTININAEQIKGDNSQSNIIKFTISFSLSDNPSQVNPHSILFEENEEDDEEEGHKRKNNSLVSDENNQQFNQQRKGDLDEDIQRGFSDDEDEETNRNLKQHYNENTNEMNDDLCGGNQQYKYCKLDNKESQEKQYSNLEFQSNVKPTHHMKNNLSLQNPIKPNSNNSSKNTELKKKRSLPQVSQSNSTNNNDVYQSKEALLLQNEYSDLNLFDQKNSNNNGIILQPSQFKENQSSSDNLRALQTPSTISFQNMTMHQFSIIQQGISSDNSKQKQVKIKNPGNEGIATSVASDNNTLPTNKQPSLLSNMNSNTVLLGNVSNYVTTSPSNLYSTSFRDVKQNPQMQQQIQSNFKDSKMNQKNEDLESGPQQRFEDYEGSNPDKQEDFQSSGVGENDNNAQNTAHNLPQNVSNYKFENQIKQKNNQITINLINPEFQMEAQNDQIQRLLNNQKIQKNIQPKQQMQDSLFNGDSSKGFNNSNLIPTQNVAEDSFSFQSPSNNVLNSIKNLDNTGQLIGHTQAETQKSSIFNTQAQSNILAQFGKNSTQQTQTTSQNVRNGGESNQINVKDNISIDSPFKCKNYLEHKELQKDDNLIIFKDEEDSKNSSYGQKNKNPYDSNDDNYSMKKRNTSHFAAIPAQTLPTEINMKTQLNNTLYLNRIEDTQALDDKDKLIQNTQTYAEQQPKSIILNNNNQISLNSNQSKIKEAKQKSPDMFNNKSILNSNNTKLTQQKKQQTFLNNKGSSFEGQKQVNIKTPQSMAQSSLNQYCISPIQQKDQTRISSAQSQQSNLFLLDNSAMIGQQSKIQLKSTLQQSVNLKGTSPRKGNKRLTYNSQQQGTKSSQTQLTPVQQPLSYQSQANGLMNSVQLPNVTTFTQSTGLAPPNIKQVYQEPLRIIKTFKPDQDLVYQKLNCLNLQVNAKLICALGPTNDIIVNEKNEFCFYLYQDMRILHSTDQQFQNNYNLSLIQFNDNYGTEQQSLTKLGAQNKSQLNISIQRDFKETEIKNQLSESQLSNLITSNQPGETCANRIDQSSFSPGKIFRNMKTVGSHPQF